jgi:hypothetical protein
MEKRSNMKFKYGLTNKDVSLKARYEAWCWMKLDCKDYKHMKTRHLLMLLGNEDFYSIQYCDEVKPVKGLVGMLALTAKIEVDILQYN